jgi:hypothetical protein
MHSPVFFIYIIPVFLFLLHVILFVLLAIFAYGARAVFDIFGCEFYLFVMVYLYLFVNGVCSVA